MTLINEETGQARSEVLEAIDSMALGNVIRKNVDMATTVMI
jgi:hypothetical protein